MTDTMTLAPAEGTWVVRAGGAVLGETTRALAVTKPDGACVIYFPKDDIGMAFLEQSTPTLVETDEGQVLFFSIVAKSRTYENAAWSLRSPVGGLDDLKGYLAFAIQDGVAVEQV